MPDFDEATTWEEVLAGQDLTGRRIVVTGASGGLGAETAKALAGAGADIVLAVRDTAVGTKVAQDIAADTGRPAPRVEALDLGRLASVRRFATRLGSEPIHALINNAGLMGTPKGRTVDGFETQMGVNHLGHFLLTQLLTEQLIAGAPSRVVTLTSSAHIWSDVDLDDLNFDNGYEPWLGYARSKTAAVLFAVELTRRRAGRGVTANAVMPGLVRGTGLPRHLDAMDERPQPPSSPSAEDGSPSRRPKNLREGAATIVWAVVAPELEGLGGLYLEDCQIARPWSRRNPMRGVKEYALDAVAAQRLWSLSEAAVGITRDESKNEGRRERAEP
ncbi:SDR family NAD(P)-dependent oxidoreductase [Pseudofrankia asymbiotica]|uniref:Short-chain dehydrogenase n=1 Tax=Pseudofrankia asymbiotica TaxID=1834516 RepID=A0A1V2I7W6_9ACTN|nr:SDR family NAD(P)-dependent oxidoreductase [Pseudofrankia asymbiotica]ONH27987.1 hypothetical protein BL253_20480 [Pseudofrankia asymbiotica]